MSDQKHVIELHKNSSSTWEIAFDHILDHKDTLTTIIVGALVLS